MKKIEENNKEISNIDIQWAALLVVYSILEDNHRSKKYVKSCLKGKFDFENEASKQLKDMVKYENLTKQNDAESDSNSYFYFFKSLVNKTNFAKFTSSIINHRLHINIDPEKLKKIIFAKFFEKRIYPKLPNAQKIYPFYKNDGTAHPAGYIICDQDKNFHIAYHGTMTSKEVINDFSINFTDMVIDNGNFGDIYRMHVGFFREFNLSKDSRDKVLLEALLENNMDDKVTISFYGHSLGGVLASISALEFKEKKLLDWSFDVKSVISFGAPKFLDKKSAMKYDSYLKDKTYQIGIKGDPILSFPGKKFSPIGNSYISKIRDFDKHSMSKYLGAVCRLYPNRKSSKSEIIEDVKFNYEFLKSKMPVILQKYFQPSNHNSENQIMKN